MKNFIPVLVMLFSIHCFSQEYHTIDVININDKNYEIQAQIELSTFKIQINDNDGKIAQSSINFTYKTAANNITNAITVLIKKLDSLPANSPNPDETIILDAVLEKITSKKESLKTELQKTTESIDGEKIEYSGAIKLNQVVYLRKRIPKNKKSTDLGKILAVKTFTDGDSLKFTVTKAHLSFFNNRASNIVIEGKLNNGEELVIVNNKYSIPLRYANNDGSEILAYNKNDSKYWLNINEVLDYKSDQHYNYSLANTEVILDKDNNIKSVQQRQFFDFFTAVLFTDLLGFDNNNSNSLVNAQAKLLVPVSLRNSASWTFVRQFSAEVNLSLYSSSNSDSRLITTNDGSHFSHFELLQKNNLNGKLGIDLITHEAKGFFSHISLGYNAGFYRTLYEETTTINNANDDIFKTQVFSLSHGPAINIEVRPQTNFGADINLSLENFSYNDSSSLNGKEIDIIMDDFGINHFGFKYNIVNLKADFYWLLNPEKGKKGGVFARLGAFYHTENYEIYPQLMVGYATNLTSFVNKFSPKEKANK